MVSIYTIIFITFYPYINFFSQFSISSIYFTIIHHFVKICLNFTLYVEQSVNWINNFSLKLKRENVNIVFSEVLKRKLLTAKTEILYLVKLPAKNLKKYIDEDCTSLFFYYWDKTMTQSNLARKGLNWFTYLINHHLQFVIEKSQERNSSLAKTWRQEFKENHEGTLLVPFLMILRAVYRQMPLHRVGYANTHQLLIKKVLHNLLVYRPIWWGISSTLVLYS